MNWRAVFNALPDPTLLLDADWNILEINQHALRLLKSGPEIRGRSLQSCLAQADVRFENFKRSCRRSRTPIPGALTFRVGSEIVKCRVKGSLISDASSLAYLIRIEGQSFVGDRTSAFQRLNKRLESLRIANMKQFSERLQLQGILDGLPVALCVLDDEGRFVLANVHFCEWFRVSQVDVKGLRPEAILGAERLQFFQRASGKRAHSGAIFQLRDEQQDRFLLEDYFEVNSRITDSILRCHTWVDVSVEKHAELEREKLKTSLLRAQKLESLGVLAGGIAHDFNNILVGILGNAELASHEVEVGSRADEYLGDLTLASKRAAELCKQMLAYSGKGRFVIEVVSLSEVVREMVSLLEVSSSKQATLNLDLDANVENICVDTTQLRQIVMNLLTNASEAIPDTGGTIHISTGSDYCDRDYLSSLDIGQNLEAGYYTWLEVSDTGCGMDQVTKERIFDPFFTTKFTGRGLGLAAVLGIVRGHLAALKVYSELGKGTTFKVLFPVTDRARSQSPSLQKQPALKQRTKKVLVVDDEACVRRVAMRAIELQGFEVLEAKNGAEALRVLEGEDVWLVLLDMEMPVMNGEKTFRQIRLQHPEIRVILSSGYNEQHATAEFVGKGLAGFIQKPYMLTELAAVIDRVEASVPIDA